MELVQVCPNLMRKIDSFEMVFTKHEAQTGHKNFVEVKLTNRLFSTKDHLRVTNEFHFFISNRILPTTLQPWYTQLHTGRFRLAT